MSNATATPAKSLLSPKDHTLLLIDFQPQMVFATKSIDAITLRNNTALISKAAKGFGVATILTTIAEKSFAGHMFDEVIQNFPTQEIFNRTFRNAWEDVKIISEVNKAGKNRLVLAGLWTSVCISGPALSALEQGYEVYVITDACGDVSTEAHAMAIQRMVQAGMRPITSLTYMLELQRDWARAETYGTTMKIAVENGGAYGLGVVYAQTMMSPH